MTPQGPTDTPVSVVVPARNEAVTIARVVRTMAEMPGVDEVVVVDNGSGDDTGAVAAAAGARVVTEARPGMGHSIRAGFIAARNDWVMKVDADLDRFDTSLFTRMITARAPGIGLIKGQWQDPRDPMPMTRYLVMPALRLMFPGLGDLSAPNSGLYAFDRSLIALPEIVGDYAADLDVMLRVHAAGARVAEVDIGRIDNNPRDAGHYAAMTEVIMAFFLRQRDLRITDEIWVEACSARQVVVGCLGVLAAHARAGGRVSVRLVEAGGEAEAALRAALAPFPTVRVVLAGEEMSRGANATGLRLIVAHPPAMQADGRRALHDPADIEVDLIAMSVDGAGQPVAGFEADHAFPIRDGAEIKRAALARLGLTLTGSREVFQSLPVPPDAP